MYWCWAKDGIFRILFFIWVVKTLVPPILLLIFNFLLCYLSRFLSYHSLHLCRCILNHIVKHTDRLHAISSSLVITIIILTVRITGFHLNRATPRRFNVEILMWRFSSDSWGWVIYKQLPAVGSRTGISCLYTTRIVVFIRNDHALALRNRTRHWMSL